MAFYIESADRPPRSRVAGSDVDVGEAVAYDGSNEAVPFDGSTHTLGEFEGVADNPRSGDQIVRDDDDTGGTTYLSAEDDRVVHGGAEDGARIKICTAEDTGGNEPTPNVSDTNVVGFIDTSAGSVSSASEYHGRIVEEGYTDGDATTFNRSNSNFVAIGVAYRDEQNAYDEPVRVQVRRDL